MIKGRILLIGMFFLSNQLFSQKTFTYNGNTINLDEIPLGKAMDIPINGSKNFVQDKSLSSEKVFASESNNYTFSTSSSDNNSVDSLKNEIVLSQDINNYHSYSIKYCHKLTSTYWLKTALITAGHYSKDGPNTNSYFSTSSTRTSLGLAIGIDKHTNNTIKGLELIYGLNIRFLYYRQRLHTDNPNIPVEMRTNINHYHTAGIGFSLGIYYNISKKFAVGSELNPYIVYLFSKYGKNPERISKGFEYDLFSNISIISIKYRW